MLDQHGRNIRYMRISVTDRCNLRCQYCMPQGLPCKKDHSQMATLEELAQIAKAAAACGVEKFRITGGEPLVRKNVVHLCRTIADFPQTKELTLTTNGILLPQYAHQLKAAGVTRLNISLDTLDPDVYRTLTGGDLSCVLQGLAAAQDAGFTNTKINVVLQKGINDTQIPRLIALAGGAISQVRFIELMPIGAGALYRDRYLPADTVLAKMPHLVPMGTSGVAQLYGTKDADHPTVGLIRPISHSFCSGCDRIRLTADGKIRPCLCSDTEYDLRGLSMDETTQKLQQIIYNKPLSHQLQTNAPTGRTMDRIGG